MAVAGKSILDICKGLLNVPAMHTLLEKPLPGDKHAGQQYVELNIKTMDGHPYLARVRQATDEPKAIQC